ncbi:GntR family transcriptional regulator, partial [Rhizobium sp. BR5]
AAIEEIWLDGSYVDTIAIENMSESLYLYYRTRLNLWISKA